MKWWWKTGLVMGTINMGIQLAIFTIDPWHSPIILVYAFIASPFIALIPAGITGNLGKERKQE